MSGDSIVWAQQAIRQRISRMLDASLFVAVDLGSAHFTCLVVRCNPGAMRRCVGDPTLDPFTALPIKGAFRRPSRGVEAGVVTDPLAAAEVLSALLEDVAQAVGARPEQAIFSISGGAPRAQRIEGRTDILMPEVDDATVARVLSACRPEIALKIRRPMHIALLDFERDGESGLRDPRGQPAGQLTANYAITTVERSALQSVAQMAKLARVGIGGIACSSAASGMAVLTDDEIELGACVVDIGAECVGVAQFQRGGLAGVEVLPMGGALLTRDLAAALEVGFDEAERQKTAQGGGLVAAAPSILGGAGPGEATAIHVGVIRPRVEEMLEMIGQALPGNRARPIVLTGGGSLLPGLVDLARNALNRRVRLGGPIRTRGATGEARDASFAAAHGLLAYIVRLEAEPMRDALAIATAPERRFSGVVDWLRRNW